MKQSTALNILKTGINVFLTGEPGSGKTYITNQYIRYLRAHKIQPAICATTGVAATHIGGMTVHAWAGIGIASHISTHDIHRIANRETVQKRIKPTHVLIIDEISMLPPHILNHVDAVCRTVKENNEPFGGIQVVYVGDFFQLPPISDQQTKLTFAFESTAWKQSQPTTCYLSEQHRQNDNEFFKLLNAIRTNSFTDQHARMIDTRKCNTQHIPTDIPQLYTHNTDVERFNSNKLKKLNGTTNTYTMHTKGAKKRVETLMRGCLSPEKLHLKIGARVMFTKNNPKGQYVNGTLATIIDYDLKNKLPIVRTHDNRIFTVFPTEWTAEENGRVRAIIAQLPLRLAWAITVHKSQGMSLDAAAMDLSNVFEYGQGYVALSRVRTLDGLYVLGYNEKTFQTHPDIRAHDEQCIRHSQETEQKFQDDQTDTHHVFLFRCGGTIDPISEKELHKPKKLNTSTPTRDITCELWKKGKTVPEIADERGLKITSIMRHIEDMVETQKLNESEVFKRLVSSELASALSDIHKGFKKCETRHLTPVQQYMKQTHNKEFSFKDLRIARIFLKE